MLPGEHVPGVAGELADDSGDRVTVRVVGHLRLPVSCDRPAVQLGGADLPVHVGSDLPVMLGPERAWHLGLHGLRSAERGIEPGSRTSDSGCTRMVTGLVMAIVD